MRLSTHVTPWWVKAREVPWKRPVFSFGLFTLFHPWPFSPHRLITNSNLNVRRN